MSAYCEKEHHTYHDTHSNIRNVTFNSDDCPYCEIDRLKGELEESNAEKRRLLRLLQMVQPGKMLAQIEDLERQLADARNTSDKWQRRAEKRGLELCFLGQEIAEARAEIDHIKQVEFPKRIEKLRAEARQETAREILEHLRSATFWVDGPDTDVVRIEFIVEYINNTYKLEG